MSMELAGELGYIKRGSKPTIGVEPANPPRS